MYISKKNDNSKNINEGVSLNTTPEKATQKTVPINYNKQQVAAINKINTPSITHRVKLVTEEMDNERDENYK